LPFDLLGHASFRWPDPQVERATVQEIIATEVLGGTP
jgi:hypothetical protein